MKKQEIEKILNDCTGNVVLFAAKNGYIDETSEDTKNVNKILSEITGTETEICFYCDEFLLVFPGCNNEAPAQKLNDFFGGWFRGCINAAGNFEIGLGYIDELL